MKRELRLTIAGFLLMQFECHRRRRSSTPPVNPNTSSLSPDPRSSFPAWNLAPRDTVQLCVCSQRFVYCFSLPPDLSSVRPQALFIVVTLMPKTVAGTINICGTEERMVCGGQAPP